MRASFDNAKGRFTPGLSARLRMEQRATYDAVLVPERAIGTDQTKKFVYVVGADGQPQFREVKLGALIDGMRVVQGGVKAGENVVVDGLQRVMPGRAGDAAGAEGRRPGHADSGAAARTAGCRRRRAGRRCEGRRSEAGRRQGSAGHKAADTKPAGKA